MLEFESQGVQAAAAYSATLHCVAMQTVLKTKKNVVGVNKAMLPVKCLRYNKFTSM